MDSTEGIARWLETQAAQNLLGKLAQRVAFDLAEAKIQPPFLELPTGRLEDVLPVLRSELSLFILEDRGHIKTLIAARDQNLSRYLQQAFTNRCRDLARRSGLDPLRYFRKRAGEVFRQTPRFHRRLRDDKFLMFSLHPENEEVQLPNDFELCAVELPRCLAQGLDFASACKKANLMDLAAHFWDRLSDMLNGRRIWVDLRDFVKWVACYVPMRGGIDAFEEEGSSGGSGSDNCDSWDIAVSEAAPLPPPTDGQVDALAAAFAVRLSQKDRAIFYYRIFASMNWEEIAHQTGFKGPSGPSYRFEEAQALLKGLLREWPGLSPEDENPETMDRFMEKLQAVLKKSLSVS